MKNTSLNSWHVLKISVLFATSFSMMLTSCEDSSTSGEPEENNFETCGDVLKDIDGNNYGTVQIGGQCWTTEDMRTTSYSDGSSIPNVTDDYEWDRLTTGAWAYYLNDDFNSDIKGKLYNWFTTIDSRGVCPTGWKVPSDDDWKTLEIELGMTGEEANGTGKRGRDANIAGKMKDTNSWSGENITNESGFSAIPTTSRLNGGKFYTSYSAFWWSTSEFNETHAWRRAIVVEDNSVYRQEWSKPYGFTIRCVMN